MTALPNPFISANAEPANHATAERQPETVGDDRESIETRPLKVSSPEVGSPSIPANDWEAAIDDMIAGFPAPPQSDANDHRFVLDVEAFEAALEPAPLFLQRGRA